MSQTRKTAPKLVRDKIPTIIRAEGREPIVSVVSGQKLSEALNAKLLEEYEEFLSATQHAERYAELADLLEVIISIGEHNGLPEADLLALCHKKRAARGGFTEGLIYSGCKED